MKKYELDLKNTTNKYNRLKSKNDEERSKYATLKHSMIEMEQKMGDLLEEQKSKDNEVSSSDEANEIILKKIKKALRSKEEQCDQLAMDKSKLEKYVQKALQTVHGKYKEACSKLQTKLDATEVKLKESDAKVEHLIEAREQTKRMAKREEQLMMSAIYGIGVQMQQRILTQPASNGSPASPAGGGSPYSPAQSWLSRTRQQRRYGLT